MKTLAAAVFASALLVGCQKASPPGAITTPEHARKAIDTNRGYCEIDGSIGKPVCSFSMTEIVLNQVPEGAVRLTGVLAKVDDDLFLFSSSESAVAKNIGDALYLDSIDDAVFSEHPDLFIGKIVMVIGNYRKISRRNDSTAFTSPGTLTVKSIRYFK